MNIAIAQNIGGLSSQVLNPPNKSIERIGERLAKARMAKELDIKLVAHKLHLSVTTVQALEQDQFDKIGTVFIRGYVKNYARLLGLDENDLPSLPNQTLPVLVKPITTLYKSQHEISSNHVLVRAVTWIIVLGIIALFGLWWEGQIAWEEAAIDLPFRSVITQPEITAPSFNRQATSTSNQTTTQSPSTSTTLPTQIAPPSPIAASPTTPISTTTTPPTSIVPATLSPTPPTQQTLPSTPTPLNPTPLTPTAMPAAVAGGAELATPNAVMAPTEINTPQPKIVLKMLKASRVEIIDATKKFKLSGNMSKGEEYTLTGQPPYAVTLEKAAAVKITIDGKPFKIKARTRNSKVNFSLDPANLEPSN